jgi:hypothetical protein
MGCVEGLNNAMIGKVATEASEKTRVKAINEMSTHADGILPLARKWARGTHKLLIISLDRTGHCVAILLVVHLADVIQRGMGLVAVARA